MILQDILKRYRKEATSERDKGDKFERLIKRYFLTDPIYCENLQEVWMWNEFPYREQFGHKDIGIDLVILDKSGSFWAIQCKFYSETNQIDKAEVDSFLSTSGKSFKIEDKEIKFSNRLFISTTNLWSKTAQDTIRNQHPPVNRLSLSELENSNIDWSKLEDGKTGLEARKEKKQIRHHQEEAILSTNSYFKDKKRGKLIMACGTGKTFTSLKIAEKETNGKGLILFLVPSIALLGQTLREWSNDAEEKIYPVCICSDAKITKSSKNSDSSSDEMLDLALPASTDIDKIVKQLRDLKNREDGLKVVFSTYQSLGVISKAQKQLLEEEENSFGEFDLIICDEAHRTTGITLENEDESSFTQVHSNENIIAKKRLYMTATPRLYDDMSKSKAKEKNAYLCSMDEPSIYGEEIYRIGFGLAVQKDLLTDYKVLILTLNSKDIPAPIQEMMAKDGIMNTTDASKLIGCINGLSKQVLDKEGLLRTDLEPMKRAVAFCSSIKDSKEITGIFNDYSDTYVESLEKKAQNKLVSVSSQHIDGSMNALQRDGLLRWLKEDSTEENECRVLTNVRCLSEGVDVPSLDAVMFLSPRNSQVDVVQSVGRVMRKSPGKKYGYIIIPVFVPEGRDPVTALDDNDTYKVVWSVLNALRAHDDRFNAEINKIDLNNKKSGNILIGKPDNSGKTKTEIEAKVTNKNSQINLEFETIQNAIYAKMVEKVGDRKYLERWATEVAEIAKIQIDRIKNLIETREDYKKAFDEFINGLQKNISPELSEVQGIEMLSQHIITKPIFEALFENYSFVKHNPVSSAMQTILDLLLQDNIEKETESLKGFYEDVKMKIGNIDNAEGKQKVIVELYDKFFKTAFPTLVEKLGIVYTPIEVVDFVINSVEDILKQEFGKSLTDENVNILDPFTGTGTFVSRLLQSKIIKREDLERKYKYEIFANEIVLLAYYIAAVNIENIFHDLNGKESNYVPFEGICLTDTFQLGEIEDTAKLFAPSLKENSERVMRQQNNPINVIIGNPPYTVGQKSENDNSKNQEYPKLDFRISETYAKESSSKMLKALYDSYIKAFRWSTDKLKNENGVIGFVTNGAWLDGTATSGFRKTIVKEFSSIYVFNLRGNARTSGEERQKEKGNVFGSGSRTPISITILVKNNEKKNGDAKIFYHDIGDYLTKDEKLEIVSNFSSIKNISWTEIEPNDSGDWLNQRSQSYENYIPLFDKENKENKNKFFNFTSNGVVTSRDAWVYSFSKIQLEEKMKSTITFYHEQIKEIQSKISENSNLKIEELINLNPKNISWSRDLKKSLSKFKETNFNSRNIKLSLYRPFTKEYIYFDRHWNECVYQQEKIYNMDNLSIFTTGLGASKPFSTLISKDIVNFDTLEKSQCYPLYYYEEKKSENLSLNLGGRESSVEKKDGITDFILNLAREQYDVPRINKTDIFYYVYGFLHSLDYREKFEADLKKVVPRIPLVENYSDFKKFSESGKTLAELHLNYETLEVDSRIKVNMTNADNYRVLKLKYAKKGDKTTLIYNSNITIENIPEEAFLYEVNGRTPVDWIIDRYQIKVDKDSGIVSDPNDWGVEHGKPRYILDLILSVITLSIKTDELVKGLPKVKFD